MVFVHGACVNDGAWWWSRVADRLGEFDIESVAVRLPSCGETGLVPGLGGPSLAEDVAELSTVLRVVGSSFVVAHSYGGVVATQAAADGDVLHLFYIASFLPDVGESLSTFGGPEPAPYLDFADDGTFGVRPEMTEELFLQDCDRPAVEGAMARLTRQSSSVVAEPVTRAAWHDIPSTYFICAEDRSTPPEVQRTQAQRAGQAIELSTGHHPMLSSPDFLARVVRTI